MTAIGRKVVGDLWQRGSRTRTVLIVLTIMLGLSVFGAVLAAYAILDRELEGGYRETNPASATLWTEAVDDDSLAAAAAIPGVQAVDARQVVTGRIRVGPVEWRTLLLIAPRSFEDLRVSRFRLQEGAWPPSDGEMLVERDAFRVARAGIGDAVTVRTPNGTDQTLRISGSVHDPGQAQARMENVVYGYVTLATIQMLGERPALDQLKLAVHPGQNTEAGVLPIVTAASEVLTKSGRAVRRHEITTDHPHADLMGLLLLIHACFGTSVLVISGLLAVHLLAAHMAGQERQVGVMQALGATRWQAAQIYLAQAAVIGIAALIPAALLGIVGAGVLARVMGVYLNFDITSAAVPAWVVLLQVVVGLAIPLAAAAYPVWNAARAPVRRALAGGDGGPGPFGARVSDRLLARVGGSIPAPLLLSIRNTARRRTRLAITVITLAAGGLFFVTALNIRASMVGMLDALFSTRRYDLSVTLAGMVPIERIERAIRATPGVVDAEGWITTQAAVVRDGPAGDAPPASHSTRLPFSGHGGGATVIHGSSGGATDRFTVLAVPPETRVHAPRLDDGRVLAPADTDALVVNSALARREHLRVGSEITLRMGPAEQTWRVVGISREPFSPPLAYVPRAFFERAGHVGMANSVRLVLEARDAPSVARVRADLDRGFERENIRALASLGTADGRFAFDQHFVMIYDFLIIMAIVILGVGGAGLASTMGLAVIERRRELGILLCLGARPRTLWFIVVAEGVVVAVVAWVLAAVASYPLGSVAGDAMVGMMFRTSLDFVFEPMGPAIWLLVSIVVGAAASLAAAWRATRLSVREALGVA